RRICTGFPITESYDLYGNCATYVKLVLGFPRKAQKNQRHFAGFPFQALRPPQRRFTLYQREERNASYCSCRRTVSCAGIPSGSKWKIFGDGVAYAAPDAFNVIP